MFRSFCCSATLLCFVGLLLYCSVHVPTITAKITRSEIDRLALLAIKSQLHDPLGTTSSWNDSVNLCHWNGVTCSREHRRVTQLNLRNQSIEGPLSPHVGNLSFLRDIDLGENSFYGEIPQEIGRLFRLETLRLTNNSFSGAIPANLSHCSNLISLLASSNNLTGAIPKEIGYLSNLEKLSIGENYLTGQIPASIGNLSAVQVIYLGTNGLGGRVPDNLGQLRSLIFLNIMGNKFSGMFPPSIYNISSLETIDIQNNRLHGSLPLHIGFSLPNLKSFLIRGNNFSGYLPQSMSNASNLANLDVADNFFNGKVLIDFSGLTDLSWLNLGKNNLGTGKANDLDFLTSLTNCTKFQNLALYKNKFGGVLPHSIANLSTTITRIAMGSNQISGNIPIGIRNLVKLNALGMEYNHLTGSIPEVIGELKNLQGISLSENDFRGSIPISLGNLSLLAAIDLQSNNLEGNIPSSLGNCPNLMELYLNDNKLTGSVPPKILGITTLSTYLGLANNNLSGPFPLEVGNLDNLVILDISGNQFSSEIPVTLGGCTSLERLYMQSNSFIGGIPSSLSSLQSLKELDISSNGLSGPIPQFLENLSFLEYLNLSYNQFEGEVPTKGVFNNLTEVLLTGNEKLCGGLEKLHLPICHSKTAKKQKKITLLKFLIPVITSCLILSLCLIIVFVRRRKFSRKSSQKLHIQEHFPMISYAELSKATNEFSSSNIIGKGSCGYVYRGSLGEDGMLVAVKVLSMEQRGASKSFMAECEALRNIRHRNLTKIITVCSSIDFKGSDFKALVYEYMPNGSLQECLYHSNDQSDACNLSLIQRLNIAIDVASAIEYLHHNCQPPIVHGDLKPSNVLLDQDMVAHVSDFGLARILSKDTPGIALENQSSSIGIKGTIGYVAPEYSMGGEISKLGDVYSFGILLLEMFTRKRPTDSMFKDGLTLHEFVKMALPERVIEIVETSLLLEAREGNLSSLGDRRARTEECLISVIRIGVRCTMESPTERTEMTNVVAKLCATRRNFLHSRI